MVAEVEGEIEKDEGVLVIKRIHVRYQLQSDDPAHEEAARRAHEIHAPKCPVYKTVSGCIDVTTELSIVS